ncbi:unnamed protein product [Victoria cruziana]
MSLKHSNFPPITRARTLCRCCIYKGRKKRKIGGRSDDALDVLYALGRRDRRTVIYPSYLFGLKTATCPFRISDYVEKLGP